MERVIRNFWSTLIINVSSKWQCYSTRGISESAINPFAFPLNCLAKLERLRFHAMVKLTRQIYRSRKLFRDTAKIARKSLKTLKTLLELEFPTRRNKQIRISFVRINTAYERRKMKYYTEVFPKLEHIFARTSNSQDLRNVLGTCKFVIKQWIIRSRGIDTDNDSDDYSWNTIHSVIVSDNSVARTKGFRYGLQNPLKG